MSNLLERVATFCDWPFEHLIPGVRLAEAGFVYTRKGDVVVCAFCAVRLHHWETNSNPLIEHESRKPDCPFIIQMNKYAKHTSPLSSNAAGSSTVDLVHIPNEDWPSSVPFSTPPSTSSANVGVARVNEKVSCGKGCVYPEFELFSSREKSFVGWPCASPDAKQMARAGFFFTGHKDCVKCFFCGGGLQNWKSFDIPYEEHVKYRPNCTYARLHQPIQPTHCPIEVQATLSQMRLAGLNVNEDILIAILKLGFRSSQIVSALRKNWISDVTEQILVDTIVKEEQSRLNVNDDNITKDSASLMPIASNRQAAHSKSITDLSSNRSSNESTAPATQSSRKHPYSNISGESLFDEPSAFDSSIGLPVLRRTHSECSFDLSMQYKALIRHLHFLQSQNLDLSQKFDKLNLINQNLVYQNEELLEDRLCSVCMEEERCIVHVPCGHFIACSTCVFAYKQCPICRDEVKSVIRAYPC